MNNLAKWLWELANMLRTDEQNIRKGEVKEPLWWCSLEIAKARGPLLGNERARARRLGKFNVELVLKTIY